MTTALDTLDDAFEAKHSKVKPIIDPRPEFLPNGFYTLTLPCGTHRTFRIFTQGKGGFAGKRLIGLLIGPENTKDFENFAFLSPDGFEIWKRFKNQKHAEYAALIWMLASGEKLDGHELAISTRCLVCNRELTTPQAIQDRIGAKCKARVGVPQ